MSSITAISRADLNIVSTGNMGGLAANVAVIRAQALTATPTPEANGVGTTGSFTFVDALTEVFAQIYHTKNTGMVMQEGQGERDGRSRKVTIQFTVPTTSEKALVLARQMLNEEIIAVGKDRQGVIYQVGTLDEPAELEEHTGTTGQNATDLRHAQFTITCSMNSMLILDAMPQTTVTPPE